MHIQIFIPVEAFFFQKGIQPSNLIIEMIISKIQKFKKGRGIGYPPCEVFSWRWK